MYIFFDNLQSHSLSLVFINFIVVDLMMVGIHPISSEVRVDLVMSTLLVLYYIYMILINSDMPHMWIFSFIISSVRLLVIT